MRERLARYVHRSLQDLPKGAGWSVASRTEGSDDLTEGDYTDSIDDALRSLGFVNEDGEPDETLATENDFLTLAKEVQIYSLERLGNYYATVNDTMAGPVRVYRSQVQKAINTLRGNASGGRKLTIGGLGVSTLVGIMAD